MSMWSLSQTLGTTLDQFECRKTTSFQVMVVESPKMAACLVSRYNFVRSIHWGKNISGINGFKSGMWESPDSLDGFNGFCFSTSSSIVVGF